MAETLTALEINAQTGEEIIRDLTAEEIADRKALQAQFKKEQAEAKAKTEARASALAKLADLGLTAEEIAAL